MTQEALNRIAEKLRLAGASLPAPEVTGTIEGAIVTGLCIALALVESEMETLTQPEQEPKIGCVNHDCDQCKAQPEQEPVAWMDAEGNVSDNNDHKCLPIPLYTKEQP